MANAVCALHKVYKVIYQINTRGYLNVQSIGWRTSWTTARTATVTMPRAAADVHLSLIPSLILISLFQFSFSIRFRYSAAALSDFRKFSQHEKFSLTGPSLLV